MTSSGESGIEIESPMKTSTPVVVRGPGFDQAAVHEFTSVETSCAENDATLEPMIVDRNAASFFVSGADDQPMALRQENNR
jgi:hypothetical protein